MELDTDLRKIHACRRAARSPVPPTSRLSQKPKGPESLPAPADPVKLATTQTGGAQPSCLGTT